MSYGSAIRYGVLGSLFFLTYLGVAGYIVHIKSNTAPPSFAMYSPLVAVQLLDYQTDIDTLQENNWGSHPERNSFTSHDETSYLQDQWQTTDPNSGFGYWSNGKWILLDKPGEGYWRNGEWAQNRFSQKGE